MPKAGGTGTRSSVRVAEKAALEAEQAAAVVDAETTAKEANPFGTPLEGPPAPAPEGGEAFETR